MAKEFTYHINVNADKSEVIQKLLDEEALLNKGKKDDKQINFIDVNDPDGAIPGANITLYIGVNKTTDKLIYDAYCDPYTGYFTRFTDNGSSVYVENNTLNLEKVYSDLDDNGFTQLHLALAEALKDISADESAKKASKRAENGARNVGGKKDEGTSTPKPDRERNHPIRNALANLRKEKTEPEAPITGEPINDFTNYKNYADPFINAASIQIISTLTYLTTALGEENFTDLSSRQITDKLNLTYASLTINKRGLIARKNDLKAVLNNMPNADSLDEGELSGGSETSRSEKIQKIKKGYADYEAIMEAEVEKADRVLALVDHVFDLGDPSDPNFQSNLNNYRDELTQIKNMPELTLPDIVDDEADVEENLDTSPSHAEKRQARIDARDARKAEKEAAKAEREGDVEEGTPPPPPPSDNPLAPWADDVVVDEVVT